MDGDGSTTAMRSARPSTRTDLDDDARGLPPEPAAPREHRLGLGGGHALVDGGEQAVSDGRSGHAGVVAGRQGADADAPRAY
jgi:hypothetical protein